MDSSLKTERVLVTGASGYLGEKISRHLSDSGFSVRHGFGSRTPHWAASREDLDMLQLDITNHADCVTATQGITAIVHLAAINEHDCVRDPHRAIKINSIGTLNLLNACKGSSIGRFIYFSTAHVFGVLEGHITENSPALPSHPYAYTHHLGEDIVRSFAKAINCSALSIRLSNCFGAPVSPDMNRWTLLVNDLCRQAVTAGVLNLVTTGEQLRDFVGINDVTRAVAHSLTSEYFAKDRGEIYNFGGNYTCSIYEMAKFIAQRAEIILGRPILVTRPEINLHRAVANSTPPSQPPTPGGFRYDSSRFAGSGFTWQSEASTEIDEMLRFCSKHFKSIRN
ncbi:MAG: SDR family oxidoreductase [Proteobacteria bacterium]|nr:SDR family oxidoreductase [Pseudomonadota bacterium]